jgi:hypothetical protein
VIFPPGLERQAAAIVDISRQLNAKTLHTIGSQSKKISIVLQNQTTNANGYVGLGPWRSEFYLTPLQNSFNLGSLPWFQSLALHEYRHVQQFNNFNKGVSKAVYRIFGEQGLALVNSAAVPDWFWEGDAVFQETLTSRQGRGRLPDFFNGYRSIWAADKNYSWLKLRNGSLRDYVPNHYELGYLMVSYGREKFGDSIWAKITDDAVRYKGLVYPWQKAIKKHTGLHYPQFRNDVLTYFRKNLVADTSRDLPSAFAASRNHFAGDELYPQWINEDQIIFVKSSYKRIPAFVVRDLKTNKERKIRVKDVSIEDYFSYRNGKLVYAAYVPAARWGWRDYSELRLVDVKTGKQQQISSKTKYFSPDISEDGEEIVAVHVDASGENNLHIISVDASNNKEVIQNGQGLFYTYPKFSGKQKIVCAARNSNGEMALVEINRSTGEVTNLSPWSMNVIGYPSVKADTISFTASYNGLDKLFLMVDKQLYRFIPGNSNRFTGNYQLSFLNGNYSWSAFTAAGHKIFLDSSHSRILEPVDLASLNRPLPDFGAGAIEDGSKRIELNSVPGSYPITKYAKSFRLFNPHSFRPYFNEPDYTFSVLGENVLNTFISEAYFNYNTNERSKEIGVNFNYGALFPWIRAGGNYTFDRSSRYSSNRVFWNEAEMNAGLTLPLNLSRGKYFRQLRVSSDIVYNKREFKGVYKDSFDNRAFAYSRTTLNFSNQLQKARKHIYPRLAQTLLLSYSRSVSSLKATQFMASGYLYVPGLALTHNLVINLAFQTRDTLRNANFSNSFPFSRGYLAENYHQMYKLGVNYHFPLVYPDWGIASVIYFQRIRANVFYDFTRVKDFNQVRKLVSGDFRSAGIELFFDTKWWNQHPVSLGIRYSNLQDARRQGLSEHQWEFILPISL